MTEAAVKPKDEIVVAEEAPAPNLPAVRQERAPRKPAQPKAPAPAHFPARIAKSIIQITQKIGKIQKEGRNEFQRYNYTRWEDINERLSPLLAEHGLIIVQSEQSRNLLEENDKGSVLAIVYHFTIINEEGEQWPPVEWTSIARLRDAKGVTDDKAAAKCHTQAEKQFCIKQFKIVSDDHVEGDASTTLPKKDARDIYAKMQAEIDACASLVELDTWAKENSERVHTLPRDWQNILRDRFKERRGDLENQQRGFDRYTGEVIDDPQQPAAEDRQAAAVLSPPAAAAATNPGEDDRALLFSIAREAAMRGKNYFDAWAMTQNGEARDLLRATYKTFSDLFPK